MQLILASTSPYRKELLERLQVPFECQAPNVDEDELKAKGLAPQELAVQLAFLKAKAVAENFPNAIVIGGDQVANLDGEILGKPGSKEKAVDQLLKMQGKTHQLITAISIVHGKRVETFSNITTLKMKAFTKEQLSYYVSQDNPINCAGSYMLEKLGIALFDTIESSDHSAIQGIPLIELSKRLENFGLSIFE